MKAIEFDAICSDPRRKADSSISLYLTSLREFSKDEWLELADSVGREERTVRLYPVGTAPPDPMEAYESVSEALEAPAPEPLGKEKTASQRLRGCLWKRFEEMDDHLRGSYNGFEPFYQERMRSIINAVREGRI